MKLHLPKLLCVAVMAAMALPAVGAEYPEIVVTDAGNKYVNVGHATTKNEENKVTLPTDALTGGVFKVGSGDLVGLFSSDPTADSFVKKYYSGAASTDDHLTTISNSLTVNGDVEISGSGQIYLGGKSGSNHYSNLTAKNVTITADATGTSASTDPQNAPNLNLRADSAKFETLTVNNGAVHLRTFLDSGDRTYGPGLGGSWKSVGISKGLYVNGGYVLIGRQGNGSTQSSGNRSQTNTHFMSSIRGELKQTGGTLIMQGKTYIETSAIEQTGGNMKLAYDNTAAYDFLRLGNSSTTITQNATDASTNMHIEGKIINGTAGTGNMKLNIEQKGVGTISLDNGVMFTTKDASSASNITQSGNGTINLAGDYSSALFNIDQTASGTINLKKGAVMVANTVNAGKDATLNINGTLSLSGTDNVVSGAMTLGTAGTLNINGTLNLSGTDNVVSGAVTLGTAGTLNLTGALKVESGSTLHFDVAAKDRAAIQAAESGNLTVIASTVSVSMSETLQSTMESEAMAKLETLDSFTYTIDLIKLSSADSAELAKLIDDEQLVLSMALPQTMATASEDLDYTITQGLRVEDNVLQATVTWQAVKAGEQIPEPATATLSLLALAGLAARRRRR